MRQGVFDSYWLCVHGYDLQINLFTAELASMHKREKGKHMRFLSLLASFFLSTVSANGMAFETDLNPQAMVYLSIALDGGGTDNKTSFGFRLDSHAYSRYDNVPYIRQLERPAVFDFKMAPDGIEGIYFSGIDYYSLYQVNRQNQDEDEYEDQVSAVDEIKAIITDMSSIAPMGVWLGAGLGVVLLLGPSK